jgi:predicted MFS family arabinose efflux permease
VSWSSLWPDTSPLRGPGARGFRAVFLSRTVVYLGSQAAEVALVRAGAGAVRLPAATPRIVPRAQLTAAAAIMSLSVNASVLIGSSLGGVLAVAPGPRFSLTSGGLACAAAVAATYAALPAFRHYSAPRSTSASDRVPAE